MLELVGTGTQLVVDGAAALLGVAEGAGHV
jgi:hypothetical protein